MLIYVEVAVKGYIKILRREPWLSVFVKNKEYILDIADKTGSCIRVERKNGIIQLPTVITGPFDSERIDETKLYREYKGKIENLVLNYFIQDDILKKSKRSTVTPVFEESSIQIKTRKEIPLYQLNDDFLKKNLSVLDYKRVLKEAEMMVNPIVKSAK